MDVNPTALSKSIQTWHVENVIQIRTQIDFKSGLQALLLLFIAKLLSTLRDPTDYLYQAPLCPPYHLLEFCSSHVREFVMLSNHLIAKLSQFQLTPISVMTLLVLVKPKYILGSMTVMLTKGLKASYLNLLLMY